MGDEGAVLVTMFRGEPHVVVWSAADVDEAMDAAREMGLPLAGEREVRAEWEREAAAGAGDVEAECRLPQ